LGKGDVLNKTSKEATDFFWKKEVKQKRKAGAFGCLVNERLLDVEAPSGATNGQNHNSPSWIESPFIELTA